MKKEETIIIRRLSLVGILGNILLTVFKLFAGIAGKSGAMVSDAVHSLSDVLATAAAYLGVQLSHQKADKDHPYGHERFESVAALALGLVLGGTGLGIGWSGIQNIIRASAGELEIPTILPLAAAVISILGKEGMYRYTMHYAKILESAAFRADAWHHRSDALSSIGSFAGILGALLGFPVLEPIASVIICLFILKVAFDILKNALEDLLDTSCGAELENEIREFILGVEGVEQIDLLRTRRFGSAYYIDAEIGVRRDSSLVAAHTIAEKVHHETERAFPRAKHIMIHVNPCEE